MSPKVVIKDVARSLEIGGDKSSAFKLANHITSIMPDADTIEDAISENNEFANFMEKYPDVKEYSSKLQNLTRQWSVHAAGVVIGDTPLYEIIPLRIEKSKTGESDVTATQWEKTRVEEFGLVKMDVLGLNTLNTISDALRYICDKTGLKIKQEEIPLDDEKTYEMISRGDNIGVFQLESSLSPLCAKIKPKDVDTIAAINALGRPSCPAEQRQAYIKRRFGLEKIRYTHEKLEVSLKDTYGVSLFEEGMMSIAKHCAGWDLNEADNLRKITKLKGKDPELVIRTEKNFIKGCMDVSGMTYEQAKEVWDNEIASFSGYGFNRSLIFSQEVSVIPPEGGSWQDVEIQNVKPGSTVLSREETTGQDIRVKVLNNHYHVKLKLFKITLDNGEEVKCTINHKFRTTDGRMLPLHQILKEDLEIVTKQ
jgi:DNA polymerase-3 subunit alpha